jgi:hypothetical protein
MFVRQALRPQLLRLTHEQAMAALIFEPVTLRGGLWDGEAAGGPGG